MLSLERDWSPKTVLVTGGSRGIGRAACLKFAEAGATVFTCARSVEALEETVEQAEGPGRVVPVQADVSAPEGVETLFKRIENATGRLDALVNNAGVLGPRTRIADVSFDDWRHVMNVNLDGVFLVSKAALQILQPGAVVLNVSSSVGRQGRGEWGPYAVSKHGVEGLTGTLADELEAQEISVVSINPGGTATNMRAEAYPDEDPSTLPQPAEIADTFLLLADRLAIEQSGNKYNSRDLLPHIDQDADLDLEALSTS